MDMFPGFHRNLLAAAPPNWHGALNTAPSQGPSLPVSYSTMDIEELIQPSQSDCDAYELYVHLQELSSLWYTRSWPLWANEEILRAALQGLELTFRMLSCALCDARHYVDKEEWARRLEALANAQLEIISLICEGDWHAPTSKLCASTGLLAVGEAQEVWQRPGALPVVSKSSQESLLPRLACWNRARELVARLHLAIECHMLRAPFTLGLGEPNLAGKPILEYDQICKPLELYECRQSMQARPEDHTLSTAHQILECWLFVGHCLLKRVERSIQASNPGAAARSSWIVERVWKLLSSTMDLLLLMDPNDFMKLKHELAIHNSSAGSGSDRGSGGGAYCLRSKMLRRVTKECKELRHLVPKMVGVEADPKGGPRLQEALMELLLSHALPPPSPGAPARAASRRAHHNGDDGSATVHLLQAFQAIEASVRQFYFAYQQLVASVMGSGEFKGSCQPLQLSPTSAIAQIYDEPAYFPSLDGAKTFLGDHWRHNHSVQEGSIMKQLLEKATSKSSSMCCSGSDSEEFSSGFGGSSSMEN